MRKKLWLAITVLLIAGAIFYLENPGFLQSWFGGTPSEGDVVLGMIANPPGDQVGLEAGKAAPNFALRTLEGAVVRLSDFRGQKHVIVNFWASWCGPCKVEMPDLETAYQQHKDQLVVLGVDLQESVQDVKDFLKDEVQVTYPILMDDQGQVAEGYNKFAQPTSLLLDKDGIIRSRKNGAYTPEELEQRVLELLSSSSKPDDEAQVTAGTNTATRLADVHYGKLGEKFFGPGEIKQIGLEIDLAQVPYRADLDLERLRLGCPVVDCIPSIDAPRFETASAVDWLEDQDLVVALAFQGISRAYAVNVLNWHEIVNDDFNGTTVLVSYCPLCNSAVSFVAPTLQGQVATFGVSGRLYNSDLVLYDRVTKSMWSQIERAVIAGPLAGNSPPLDTIPVDIVPWESWKAQHPNGQVLARPMTSDALGGKPPRDADPAKARLTRDFNNDPYRYYKVNNADTFGLPLQDERLPAKAEVVGVEVGESAKAYPRDLVVANKLINDRINGVPVALIFDETLGRILAFERPSPAALSLQGDQVSDGRGSWQLDGQAAFGAAEPLKPIRSTPAFWFAWAAFHPQTELYSVKSQ